MHSLSLAGVVAIGSALMAAAILVHQLWAQPKLDVHAQLRLFLGLGVLPVIAALSSTAQGMHTTTQREFCGSCHVMQPHFQDSENPRSNSLAAKHARNRHFGPENCYLCHADYGMLGYPLTKLNGMKHVYEYYLGGFRELTLDEALPKIHLYQPFKNQNCRECHSGQTEGYTRVADHQKLEGELLANNISCASAGCHGYAHPFSKPKHQAPLP